MIDKKKFLIIRLSIFPALLFLNVDSTYAQLQPQELSRGDLVRLLMRDSSHFYGIVVSTPIPGRIVFQTRNGKLEIPLDDIITVVDLRDNTDIFKEIINDGASTEGQIKRNNLRTFLAYPKLSCQTSVRTINYDVYRGNRYSFDDSAHVILATDWGELFFNYIDISFINNYSCRDDVRDDFLSAKYHHDIDPTASQGFILPTAYAFGEGNNFFSDYLLGGLQINYGATNWLSLNEGGVFLPVKNTVIITSGGAKLTPYSSALLNVSLGFQGLYSRIIKTTDLLLGYGAITFGTWESNLTLFGGYDIDHTDSLGYKNTKNDRIIAIEGTQRLEKDLKLTFEIYFISNFDVIPLLVSLRYFHYPFTVDVGFVFSLFKSEATAETKTIGEDIFNVQNFPILPVLSMTYHF